MKVRVLANLPCDLACEIVVSFGVNLRRANLAVAKRHARSFDPKLPADFSPCRMS